MNQFFDDLEKYKEMIIREVREAERTRIIKALEGLRAEIIEKIIGDYDEALSLEEIGYLTKDRVKQLKDKWL